MSDEHILERRRRQRDAPGERKPIPLADARVTDVPIPGKSRLHLRGKVELGRIAVGTGEGAKQCVAASGFAPIRHTQLLQKQIRSAPSVNPAAFLSIALHSLNL